MDPIVERLKAIETKLSQIEKTVVKIRSVQRTGATMRALYWIVIILVGFGAFYFIQPYFEQLKEAYGFVGNNNDSQNIQELLDQLKGEDR